MSAFFWTTAAMNYHLLDWDQLKLKIGKLAFLRVIQWQGLNITRLSTV
jgi:hypothetical protein